MMTNIETLDRDGLELETLREDIRTKQAHTALLQAQTRQATIATNCMEKENK